MNEDAQLVGINTAIVGHAYQGIGFAIPSELAKRVYELLRTGGISRGWIGVGTRDLTKGLAEKLELKDTRGALVAQVTAVSPADKAGLQPGDVIVQWDNQPIANSNDLRIAVARTQPGTKATVACYRGGQRQELTITTAERPNKAAQIAILLTGAVAAARMGLCRRGDKPVQTLQQSAHSVVLIATIAATAFAVSADKPTHGEAEKGPPVVPGSGLPSSDELREELHERIVKIAKTDGAQSALRGDAAHDSLGGQGKPRSASSPTSGRSRASWSKNRRSRCGRAWTSGRRTSWC